MDGEPEKMSISKRSTREMTCDSQNLINAGDVASLSPLIALARIYPALSTFGQNPGPDRLDPLPHADANLAIPTKSQ